MSLAVRQAAPPLRRHTDPPGLWIGVLLGSFVLNGVFFLSFQRYLQPTKTVAAFAPIAIDFVPANSQLGLSNVPPSQKVPVPTATVKPVISSNHQVTRSTPSSVAPKAGGISIGASTQSARPQASAPPSSDLTEESATSFQEPQTDTSAKNSDLEATGEPLASQTDAEVTEDKVATSGVMLPGYVEPPNLKTNTGESVAAATDLVDLNRKAIPSKYLMRVKVLALGDAPPAEAGTSPEQFQQSKTLLSGEAGCFVTPEALHHFNQSLDYTLTLNEQGTVVAAVPIDRKSVV